MASIIDVAKRAGVSKSTVSKVLNNYEMISTETKNKVKIAIQELGYVPNHAAVSLSKRNVTRVALIIDINYYKQAIDEIDIQYLFGAFDKSREVGLDCIPVFTSQLMGMDGEQISRYLKSQSITGLIIYSYSKENIALYDVIISKEFKVVIVDSVMTDEGISSVSVDHYKAQYDVAKKVVTTYQCKTILYIAGGLGGYDMDPRLSAVRRLMQQENLELFVEQGGFSEKKAREITFQYGKQVDAVICASDLMAIGASIALREMEIDIPVSGYDGIKLLGYIFKPIYTVKQDFCEISRIAFEELMYLTEGGIGRHKVLEHSVIKINYDDVII